MSENGEENRDSEDAAAGPEQANNETDSNSNSAGKHSVTLSQHRAVPAYRRSAPRSRRTSAAPGRQDPPTQSQGALSRDSPTSAK